MSHQDPNTSRRARRKARKQRPSQVRQAAPSDAKTIVGWFAFDGKKHFRTLNAVVVVGERKTMEKAVRQDPDHDWKFDTITFDEVFSGLSLGSAYAFDEDAYYAFLPLAQEQGLRLGPEDFSNDDPSDIHLVRLQLPT